MWPRFDRVPEPVDGLAHLEDVLTRLDTLTGTIGALSDRVSSVESRLDVLERGFRDPEPDRPRTFADGPETGVGGYV